MKMYDCKKGLMLTFLFRFILLFCGKNKNFREFILCFAYLFVPLQRFRARYGL